MKQLVIFFLAGMFFAIASHSQVPLPSFTAPSSACLQETVALVNTSVNATAYEWDICADDFQSLKSNLNIATLTNLINGFGYKLVEDNGSWYGFLVSQGGLRLFRTDFGSSPLNVPIQTVDLGNPGNALSFPQDIEIYKANGKWYGFVGSNDNGYGVVRLDFGASITSSPSATNIGTFGVFGRFWDLKVIEQGSNLILVIHERNNGTLIRVNYRNAFENSIVNGTHVFVTGSVTNQLSPGFDLIQNNGNWIALVTSYADNKLYQVTFGNDIFSTLVIQSSFSLPTFNKPMRVRIVREGNRYVGVVSNESTVITLVDLKDLNPANTPTLISHSGLPNFIGLDVQRFNGKSVVLGVGTVDNRVRQLVFESNCGATPSFLTTTSPSISYSEAGTKVVELKASNSSGSTIFANSIGVSFANAPDIDFSILNMCVNSPVEFSVINASGGITSYDWDFGDGNLGTGSSVQHNYLAPAPYSITLKVNASNGCSNRSVKSHTIYNRPQASFVLPGANPFCTNQAYQFVNNSTFDVTIIPNWQWSINGVGAAITEDLLATFSSPTLQQISLTASIPGCSTQVTQVINSLEIGPLTNFSFGSGCEGSPVSFTNTTAGSVTSYAWTFGDGNNSVATSPSNTYLTSGNYSVTLQTTNAAGCQNSVTKLITIYSTPQPDFSIGLPPFSCAGSSSQFTDLTPAPTDSNITNWTWGFGDAANGSSLVKNPSYTYTTANTYNVSLAVATNFGCTNSIQKAVSISPSPVAGFSNLPACVNQTTQFTDASSGSIKSRLWQIQSSTFTTPNPQFIFPSAGSFPVILAVTGNNNCVSQANKNIVVPVVPPLDFSVQAPCANSPTIFTELTTSADPSISKSWSFGSQGTGSGSPVQYAFTSTSSYVVRLNSTRQSGCVYSVSKNVSIVSPPIADFVPSIDAGAAPLPVSFTNNSSGANSYLWKFGDPGNSTSVLASPTFVFSELGSYNVELSASNSVGCTNRLSKPISVVVPNVDAEMTDFFFVKDPKTGSLQPVVKLLNRSNITLTNPIILLDVAGGSGVSQQLTGAIKPNQEVSQMLDLKLVPKTNQYVCAEVVIAGDVDTFLNRKCLSLSGEEVLFAPFPNPAREQLNMDWISIDGSAVTFQVLTSAGAVSFQQTISSINPGLNRLVINTSTLLSGTYFIRFRDRTNDRTFSLVVLGN
jgi:PKD repeat protein